MREPTWKPCPNPECQADESYIVACRRAPEDESVWNVECSKCHTRGPEHQDEGEADRLWNLFLRAEDVE